VAERKPFLLRIDATVLEALQRWANDDLRSLNGQIEFVLRQSLRASGRHRGVVDPPDVSGLPGAGSPAAKESPDGQP
jgi:hypothetical protein